MKTENQKHQNFWAYTVGVCSASVCSSLPLEEVTAQLNREHPTGISSQWTHSKESFADGSSNPWPCPDSPANKHYLFEC